MDGWGVNLFRLQTDKLTSTTSTYLKDKQIKDGSNFFSEVVLPNFWPLDAGLAYFLIRKIGFLAKSYMFCQLAMSRFQKMVQKMTKLGFWYDNFKIRNLGLDQLGNWFGPLHLPLVVNRAEPRIILMESPMHKSGDIGPRLFDLKVPRDFWPSFLTRRFLNQQMHCTALLGQEIQFTALPGCRNKKQANRCYIPREVWFSFYNCCLS